MGGMGGMGDAKDSSGQLAGGAEPPKEKEFKQGFFYKKPPAPAPAPQQQLPPLAPPAVDALGLPLPPSGPAVGIGDAGMGMSHAQSELLMSTLPAAAPSDAAAAFLPLPPGAPAAAEAGAAPTVLDLPMPPSAPSAGGSNDDPSAGAPGLEDLAARFARLRGD
jgi:hypothetical protein